MWCDTEYAFSRGELYTLDEIATREGIQVLDAEVDAEIARLAEGARCHGEDQARDQGKLGQVPEVSEGRYKEISSIT